MSHRERWGQVLPESKKNHMYSHLNQMQEKYLMRIRHLMLELSLPNIDDPNADAFIEKFKDEFDYSHYSVLSDFMGSSDYWWHVREWARFVVGHHKPIPDAEFNLNADFARHFPHISREDDSRIAIVMDQSKAAADLHTTMKIGRYLSKQTDAPEAIIPDISNRYANRDKTYQLEVANTPAEIQWVYENGPSSCMGKTIKVAGFHSRVHPTHAYATPDICILYVRDREDPNRVISRTVASTINHTFVRIFGNAGIIMPLLNQHGWENKQMHGLNNHRLLSIKQEVTEHGVPVTKHIGPYLDCGNFPIYTDPRDDKYLIINPQTSELQIGKKIGSTERSYNGKGFMDAPPMMTCVFCQGEFNPMDGSIRHHEHDNINVCNGCTDHMIYAYLSSMDTIQVDPVRNDQLFTKKLISSAYVDTDSDDKVNVDYVYEEYVFLNEEEYENTDLPVHYKTGEPMYAESSSFVPSVDGYAVHSEVKAVTYTKEQFLIEDLVWLGNNRVYKGHVEHGRFKYNTVSKIPIDEILRNLRNYYFNVSKSGSNGALIIKSVSKTEKAGHMRLDEIIASKISYSTDHGTWYEKSLDNDREMTAYLAFIPDDTDGLLFRDNTTSMSKFSTSNIMYMKALYVIKHPNLARNLPVRKKPMPKKQEPSLTSFDLGATADMSTAPTFRTEQLSGEPITGSTTDRTRWVDISA